MHLYTQVLVHVLGCGWSWSGYFRQSMSCRRQDCRAPPKCRNFATAQCQNNADAIRAVVSSLSSRLLSTHKLTASKTQEVKVGRHFARFQPTPECGSNWRAGQKSSYGCTNATWRVRESTWQPTTVRSQLRLTGFPLPGFTVLTTFRPPHLARISQPSL